MITNKYQSQRAFSLLEMAAALALIAGTLVPALAVVRDAMATSRETHRRNLLANYAVRILEDQSALVATNWVNATINGNFASDGHTNIRYTATKSDATADGGLVNQLMHVEVTVYDDADADMTLDTSELQETYRTKIAKLNSYENEEQ
ncbi:MAG: hypothetical protein MI725_14370 [Pirellulales bacterium]|nr:hypothetical protein [Pirellulales bacterium]